MYIVRETPTADCHEAAANMRLFSAESDLREQRSKIVPKMVAKIFVLDGVGSKKGCYHRCIRMLLILGPKF